MNSRAAAGAPRRSTAHLVVGRFFDYERAAALRRLVVLRNFLYLLFDYYNSAYHLHTGVGHRAHGTTLRMVFIVLCGRRIAGCMRAIES